jgi:hypothetical protein
LADPHRPPPGPPRARRHLAGHPPGGRGRGDGHRSGLHRRGPSPGG